jgi:hypothetical protein
MPNQHLTNHLTQGSGPFGPPKRTELDGLQAENTDLRDRVRSLTALLSVDTVDDLVALLRNVLADAENIDVDGDDDGESFAVTVHGLTVNDDGEIVPSVREFQVDVYVEVEGTVRVLASDEDEATDLVSEYFDTWRISNDFAEHARDAERAAFDANVHVSNSREV